MALQNPWLLGTFHRVQRHLMVARSRGKLALLQTPIDAVDNVTVDRPLLQYFRRGPRVYRQHPGLARLAADNGQSVAYRRKCHIMDRLGFRGNVLPDGLPWPIADVQASL
jgi:hypothetical protein